MRRLLRFPRRRGPLVLDASRAGVRVEGADELTARSLERIAILAHWAPEPRLTRSVEELTQALLANAYSVVLVSTAESMAPLEWSRAKPAGVTVLRRPNLGYDFGSWAIALDRYPQIAAADSVLLVNDSLAGPFGPLDRLLDKFHASGADVWCLTDTSQFGHHLQSYFVGFRRQCLQEGPLRRFWQTIRVETSKDDVIWRDEIGLSRILARERYVTEAAIPYRGIVSEGQNPTILGWRRLLDRGFPFVKRELLRRPGVAPDGALVRQELRQRFGVDVDEWV